MPVAETAPGARPEDRSRWDGAPSGTGPEYTVVRDPESGYRRLDPVPEPEELDRFYEEQYYQLMKQGERAPDLARMRAGGEAAAREREWLRQALHADLLDAVESNVAPEAGRSLLDVGCGTGEFMESVAERGWEVQGIELSPVAVAAGRERGLRIEQAELGRFVSELLPEGKRFAAVTLLHVLEHVPHPERLLEQIHGILAPGGVVVVQVPNDFSELQRHAQEKTVRREWWVAVPDHPNYFDFRSLQRLLSREGYRVLDSFGSFPMELFLLMGDDYTADPAVGKACHRRRVEFETSIPGELRRRIYRALGSVGVGRDCVVVARRGVR